MEQDLEISFESLIDCAILAHGFMPYSRDYYFHIETMWGNGYAGQYLLRFTHCYEMEYKVSGNADVLIQSWDDHFIDMDNYIKAGEPIGYVWGTNWRGAYPGFKKVEGSIKAKAWSDRLHKPMHEVHLQAEIIEINLVYNEMLSQRLNTTTSTIEKFVFPINGPSGESQQAL